MRRFTTGLTTGSGVNTGSSSLARFCFCSCSCHCVNHTAAKTTAATSRTTISRIPSQSDIEFSNFLTSYAELPISLRIAQRDLAFEQCRHELFEEDLIDIGRMRHLRGQ